jgi:pyruvate kinase
MNKLAQKIILTCGPACEDIAVLEKMAMVASGFRLNTAHISVEGLHSWLNKLVRLREAQKKNFKIILDLQGAKVRIGQIQAVEQIPEQIEIVFAKESQDPARIPVPDESVFAHSVKGELLLFNDRKVIVEVIEADQDKKIIKARVIQNGPLSSGKGINSPDRVFQMARVTENDRLAIENSQKIENLEYAISFVADGNEVNLFRPLVKQHKLIAKIEQVAAFKNLHSIAKKFSSLWLCRGDLGAEAGLNMLGPLQNKFCRAMKSIDCSCLLAGEVLGSMVKIPQPSRAEIVQLYDALQAGFSGIVLSDETACGENLTAVVDFLAQYFGFGP